LGEQLTNISSGHYSDNFRPHDNLHKKIFGFDFKTGLYYNVGEGIHRNWSDYIRYSFISAGQATRFRDAMLGFEVGDVVVAYLKGYGFVGVGQITHKARPVCDVIIDSTSLLQLDLECPNIAENSNDLECSEYVALMNWVSFVGKNEAKWKLKSGLFTFQLVLASTDEQPETVEYLAKEFTMNFNRLIV